MNRRPRLEIIAPGASPQEAAAVVAAIEQFLRDTAPPPVPAAGQKGGWERTALLEGVEREHGLTWGDPVPWG